MVLYTDGKQEDWRAERVSAAGATAASGAVAAGGGGDAAWGAADPGAPLWQAALPVRERRVARSLPLLLAWPRVGAWPAGLRAGGAGCGGGPARRGECPDRGGAVGDFGDQRRAVAPQGAGVS